MFCLVEGVVTVPVFSLSLAGHRPVDLDHWLALLFGRATYRGCESDHFVFLSCSCKLQSSSLFSCVRLVISGREHFRMKRQWSGYSSPSPCPTSFSVFCFFFGMQICVGLFLLLFWPQPPLSIAMPVPSYAERQTFRRFVFSICCILG